MANAAFGGYMHWPACNVCLAARLTGEICSPLVRALSSNFSAAAAAASAFASGTSGASPSLADSALVRNSELRRTFWSKRERANNKNVTSTRNKWSLARSFAIRSAAAAAAAVAATYKRRPDGRADRQFWDASRDAERLRRINKRRQLGGHWRRIGRKSPVSRSHPYPPAPARLPLGAI